MSASPDGPRERLVEATREYVTEHGVGDLSLRRLAAAIGTSHRMLLYHFGSRDELLIEVIRRSEQREREALGALEVDGSVSISELMWLMWQRVADPAMWPHERLFFEVYGQALQGRPHALPLLDGIVEDWLAPAAQLCEARGMDHDTAVATARLGLAVTRGLLLDLLATEDREAVDAAARRWIDLFVAGLPHPAG